MSSGRTHFELVSLYNDLTKHDPDRYPPATEQRIRTATSELRFAGRVEDSGQRRKNSRGRNCIVWKLIA